MGVKNPTTHEWLRALVEPAMILKMAMYYYLETNARAVLSGRVLAPILNANELRDEAFGRFWVAFSANREEPTPPPESSEPAQIQDASAALSSQTPKDDPNPEVKEVQMSSDLIPPILAQASGVTLDVGPGTGTQMPLLAKNGGISAIYGAEPCGGLHAELQRRAEFNGLGDKYTILPCGVEKTQLGKEMQKVGLIEENGKGTELFDTIVTIRVLCSVPHLKETTSHLYDLLKPAGKLLVVEHVVNPWTSPKGSILARFMQGVYHALGWRWVMGDCCLDRDTEGVLRAVGEEKEKGGNGNGGWGSVSVERWFEGTCMVYVAAVFVKKA
ncbi:class I SAM-dependent methyltransferase [Aspergillus stella-maris]|uniref:class I SAM-dependent methyltransferase n=1 Tax=Aspergillus stella-maris TaxID=1810926 RepID=UPI003CCD5BFE